MIIWVSVVLRRTVCGDIDRRFNNLSGSLMMTPTRAGCQNVNVTTVSPSQDYTQPDDHTLLTCQLLRLLLRLNRR